MRMQTVRLRGCSIALALLGIVLLSPRAQAADTPSLTSSIEVYKPMYFLTTWDFEPHPGREDKELKFQISLKKRLLESVPLYVAYTQVAFWQYYDEANSRPFRSQNQNPEMFYDTPLSNRFLGGALGAKFGLEHESNGESTANSRSWNRAYFWPRLDYAALENLSLQLKAWWRFPEAKKSNPNDPAGDDNRNIEKYLGYGEFYLQQFSQGTGDELPYRRVSLMLRRGTSGGTETAQLDLAYHLFDVWHFFSQGIYLHLQAFYGYGESLIDYNHRVKKLGIGFSFY
jgi:phospholipase A1